LCRPAMGFGTPPAHEGGAEVRATGLVDADAARRGQRCRSNPALVTRPGRSGRMAISGRSHLSGRLMSTKHMELERYTARLSQRRERGPVNHRSPLASTSRDQGSSRRWFAKERWCRPVTTGEW
jgi:hypothetical protein